ncbi:MAG: 8-amino-7-oxononanoate synthase [Proteobacteria bacterium]|nr:MAG: 8-amino-7-oxononanoate synthase [Pseudomonadota bacterium]QKK11133.1 MAG: 8-amino-7-oxononanoate synthase [Pseudomonadota bacterium]
MADPSEFDLQSALVKRHAAGLYRTRRVLAGPQSVEAVVDGRACLTFCSNDYLGLANHPQVIAAFQAGAERYGVGGGASHLITGHSAAHHALEEELAAFVGRPRALLFSTGYMANLGVIAALLGRGDTVYQDRLNHASLIDAGRLAQADYVRYAHADAADLAARCLAPKSGRKLVATDGVFSMDGDLAPLADLCRTARERGAWVMVDDAHGIGVLGGQGRGTLEHFGLGVEEVAVLMGTLGKACGTAGAFVAGSEALVETLIQQARPYIYTTAMPPAVAEATRASLRLIDNESWRRAHLRALIERFRRGAQAIGLPLMDSHTPIQPLVAGDAARALRLSAALWERGILITAIRPPTVPQGSARLRITFSAAHSEAHVDRLLSALDAAWRVCGDVG